MLYHFVKKFKGTQGYYKNSASQRFQAAFLCKCLPARVPFWLRRNAVSGCLNKIHQAPLQIHVKYAPFFTTLIPAMDDLPSSTFSFHHSTPIN